MVPLGMAWLDMESLQPHCRCGGKIDYDVTTKFDERRQSHVCLGCGAVL